ncbi:MAG: hypothetical protein WBW33_21575 [Bryobacteraceae bacterium]
MEATPRTAISAPANRNSTHLDILNSISQRNAELYGVVEVQILKLDSLCI